MLHLFLLRHGKATKYQDDISDYSRTLNKQGTAQVNQLGYILREKGIKKGMEKMLLAFMRHHPGLGDKAVAEIMEVEETFVKAVKKKL